MLPDTPLSLGCAFSFDFLPSPFYFPIVCGIAAIFSYGDDAPPVDRAELLAIRDRMTSRGPDGEGEWIAPDQRVGLGHRRLAIIDLSENGAQPMFSADGQIAIIFNGEIYNYRELRRSLESRGREFRSTSDTEVLLHLYAEKGEGMLHDLRGMFAFAIWDNRKRGILLARDPFGIKPLYYASDAGTFRAASQVKALLQSNKIDTSPEPAGHAGFFLWGSVPAPFTLYRGIRNLPAGHSLWVDENGCGEPRSYCLISDVIREGELTAASGGGEFKAVSNLEFLRHELADAISHHLIADVPVGVFLSSGLDSTTIASFASAEQAGLHTVTLGFGEYRGTAEDEVPLAKKVAQKIRTEHRTIWVSAGDFEEHSDRLFDAMDQPSIDGANTYFVSLAAKRAGMKVALSGLGGDEMFGGYSSFREIPRAARLLSPFGAIPFLGRGFRVIAAPLLKHFTSPKYAGLFEYGTSYGGSYLLRRGFFMPWELPEVLDADLAAEGWQRLQPLLQLERTIAGIASPRAKVAALELSWYMRHQLLRDSDWASMAHSLELRVPFVDLPFLRHAAPRIAGPNPPSKVEMARSAPSELPAGLLDRPKTGFTIPVRDWLLKSALSSQSASKRDFGTIDLAGRGLRGWGQYVYSRSTGIPSIGPSRRRRRQRDKAEPAGDDLGPSHRILIYRIGQLGDTIVALPAMWAIRRAWPDAHLSLLFDQHRKAGYVAAFDLLQGCGIFDEFIGYPFEARLGRKATEAVRLLATVRRHRFDTLVYLAPSGRSPERVRRDRTFFRAAGIKKFVGMSGFPSLDPKRENIPLAAAKPESRLLLDRLAASGFPPSALADSFDLNLGAREARLFESWLGLQEPDGERPWIAIGPGSKMPAKKWPTERFEQVVRQLIAEFDIWPVIFGGAEDIEVGTKLLRSWGRGYNAAGALDIRTAAHALKLCALYLGNDTGTMHLAAAIGLPCVAIFSSRDRPGMWYPSGTNNVIFRSEIDCEGCGLVRCIVRDNECLKRVGAEQVALAAQRVLNERLHVFAA
jgi:asparagine synthase (glutamine-hydrolysing)